MAEIEFEGLEEYRSQLVKLGADVEGICKYATYDAAALVIDAIKANTPEDSGDLKKCISLSPFRNEDGYIYTKVGFPGYDSKGAPNAIKAAVLEHGSSTRKKHPFIRQALNRVQGKAEALIEENLNKKIEEIMGKD